MSFICPVCHLMKQADVQAEKLASSVSGGHTWHGMIATTIEMTDRPSQVSYSPFTCWGSFSIVRAEMLCGVVWHSVITLSQSAAAGLTTITVLHYGQSAPEGPVTMPRRLLACTRAPKSAKRTCKLNIAPQRKASGDRKIRYLR